MSTPAVPPTTTAAGPSRLRVQSLVALLCVLWGSTWVAIAEGLRDLPPLTSAGARFTLAFVVMLLIGPWLARRETGVAPPTWLWVTVGTLNFAVSYAVVYTVETVLPSGIVSVLWAVFPLLMAVAGRVALAEVMRPRQWLGLLLGLTGVGALFATDLADFGAGAVPMALLLFVSPLVSVVGQTYLKRYGAGVSSVLVNRNAMGLGAAWLLAGAALFEDDVAVTWSARALVSVVWLALFGTVTTFSLYFWLLRHAPATKLSVITFITPLIALLLGHLVAGEAVSGSTLLGTALVVCGVALAVLPASRRARLSSRS